MNRRNFIKTSAIAAPLLGVFPAGLEAVTREIVPGKLEKRVFGKTGKHLSIIGFGGITIRDISPYEASENVEFAIKHGVNWFDSSPTYADSEPKLGPALEPYRKDVFLACKTRERTQDDAERQLEQSLKDLRTDHFDLYQLHVVTTMDDVNTIFSKNGALKTLIKAREDGRTKYLGFSAHSVEAALELMRRFEFDTILFPFNLATWHKGNFGPQVLQVAKDKGMGIIALKPMAERRWDREEERSIGMWYKPYTEMADNRTALRFALSHPITGALPPGNPHLFKMGVNIGLSFKPLKRKESEEIKRMQFKGIPMFTHEG